MQPCLFWTGERAELRITSVELLTEYHLAGVLAHSEVVSGRVEVLRPARVNDFETGADEI